MVAGCGSSEPYWFKNVSVDVPSVSGQLAIAVLERRPYVLNGDKDPEFRGLIRGTYGIPFSQPTLSGRPLADAFRDALVSSFQASGADVRPLIVPRDLEAQEVIPTLGPGEKLLWVEVREWKSDIWERLTSHWDLSAEVYSSDGSLRASESYQGIRGTVYHDIENNAVRPVSPFEQAELKRQFDELLNRPAIVAALAL